MEDPLDDGLEDAITGRDDQASTVRGFDFHIRLTALEKERLVRHAADWSVRMGLSGEPQGLNLSRYARETLLAPHAEDQAVTRGELIDFRDKASRLTMQVAKVGNNINQVARVANARGVVLDRQVLRLVEEMKPLLHESAHLIHDMVERCL